MLLRLALACVIFALSHLVAPFIFSELFAVIIILLGKQNDSDFIYNISWAANEFACYFIPIIGIGAIFFKELFGKEKLSFPRADGHKGWHYVLYYSAMTSAGFVASSVADYISDSLTIAFGTEEIKDVIGEVAPETTGGLWGYLICVCLIAPVCEELLFRFALLKPMRKCGDWFAVITSAVLFSVFHGNFDQAPYALAVGVILGIVAVRSGSVIPSIILHSVNNIIVSAVNYLPKDIEIFNAISEIASSICTAIILFGFVALLWLFFTMKKKPLEYRLSLDGREWAKALFAYPAFYIGAALCVTLFI